MKRQMLLFILWLLGATLAAGAEPLFRFVQFSDTHLHDAAWIAEQQAAGRPAGRRLHYDTPGTFRQAVAWVANQPDIAFAVLTGDMVERALPVRYETLRDIMAGMPQPWFLTEGNHDYGLHKLLPEDGSRGGDNLWFAWRGVYFVGLSTYNPPGMSSVVRRDSLAALAAFRQAHPAVPLVLLSHAPLVDRRGRTESWECPDNAAQVAAVLDRAGGLEAALSGHDHGWWSMVVGGTLHASAPGFCEAIAPFPPFAFVVWDVHADRLAGRLFHVTEAGDVAPLDTQIEHPWPAERRPAAAGEAVWRVQPLPAPPGDLLTDWFGADWVHAPGYELPPSWRDDVVILPAREAKAAVWLDLPPQGEPPPDAAGRPWHHPDYAPAEPWQAVSLPAGYWDSKNPQPGHRQLYFRLNFAVDPAILDRMRLAAVRLLNYRSPRLFVNGERLPAPANTAAATYWNASTLVPVAHLRPQNNVLAVTITTSGWGGYRLDAELAACLADPDPEP